MYILVFCLDRCIRKSDVKVMPTLATPKRHCRGTSSSSVADVTLHGGPRASTFLNIAEASSLHHEYSSMACTIEIVDDVYAAMEHIHKHGRHAGITWISFSFVSFSTYFF